MCAAQRWEAFLHHWIWDAWRRYFRARGIVPVPPYCEPGKRYIFAHFPHAGERLLPCKCASCPDTCCTTALPAALLLAVLVARPPWHFMRGLCFAPRNLQPEKVAMAVLKSGSPLSACLRMMPSSRLTTSGHSSWPWGARRTC